jgi:hypothetical protein
MEVVYTRRVVQHIAAQQHIPTPNELADEISLPPGATINLTVICASL